MQPLLRTNPTRIHSLVVSELRDYLAGWASQPYEYDYYVDGAYVSVK